MTIRIFLAISILFTLPVFAEESSNKSIAKISATHSFMKDGVAATNHEEKPFSKFSDFFISLNTPNNRFSWELATSMLWIDDVGARSDNHRFTFRFNLLPDFGLTFPMGVKYSLNDSKNKGFDYGTLHWVFGLEVGKKSSLSFFSYAPNDSQSEKIDSLSYSMKQGGYQKIKLKLVLPLQPLLVQGILNYYTIGDTKYDTPMIDVKLSHDDIYSLTSGVGIDLESGFSIFGGITKTFTDIDYETVFMMTGTQLHEGIYECMYASLTKAL